MSLARVAVLASGRGSNCFALAAAARNGSLPAEIVLVLANRREAAVLPRAAELGLPTVLLDDRDFASRLEHEVAVVAALRQAGVQWVCLAGYMRLVGPTLLAAYPNRILNIHPSLLPSFPGLDAQGQALAYGVAVSGCTVHFVDAGLDSGPIVGQRAVAVLDRDDKDSLSKRILEQEHQLYAESLGRLLIQPWFQEGRRICWHGEVSR